MARNPQLRAQFFVSRAGVAMPKAPPLSTRLRRAIFKRDGGRCGYCGVRVSLFRPPFSFTSDDVRHAHIDHIFPRSRGGQNDPDNLRLACVSCNESKAAD